MKLFIAATLIALTPAINLADNLSGSPTTNHAKLDSHQMPQMNQEQLESIIKSHAISYKGGGGAVEFRYNNVDMHVISDAKHNRMRIIAPIANYTELSPEHVHAAMESNFHKALDARYAVSGNVLYSAFIHPLSLLHEEQVTSAMLQVSNLALSFGKEYTSGVLNFGGEQENKETQH